MIIADDLICPTCRGPVKGKVKDGRVVLFCPALHGPWLVEDRVAHFVTENVSHDGRWATTYREPSTDGLWGWFLHRNANWGIPHLMRPMIRRLSPQPRKIVDLGCGGGWEFLTEYARVTGVDHGVQGLNAATKIYDRLLRASVTRLPLRDGSVDAVVSVWLFEHLSDPRLFEVLRETRRVLRPGGHLIFLTDLDSSKPILRWAKGFAEDYRRYHIEAVGHYGLRSLADTRALLQTEGFVEYETKAVNKSSLLQPVTARWMFDNDLGRRSACLRLYLWGCRSVLKSKTLYRLVYLSLMEYHRLVDRWLPDPYGFSAVFDWVVPERGNRSS